MKATPELDSNSINNPNAILINKLLKDTKGEITIEYGSVYEEKEGANRSDKNHLRYYDKYKYTLDDLYSFIDKHIANYDKKIVKPKNAKQTKVYHSQYAYDRDTLIKHALGQISTIINNIKRQVAEKHTLEYMQQNNIPLIPSSETKRRRDSFIGSYGSQEEKENGKPYGVIKNNPFPAKASTDIKLLTSEIWNHTNEQDIANKRNQLCKGIYEILKPCLTKEKNTARTCDLFGFEVKNDGSTYSYSGDIDSQEYQKKGAGSISTSFKETSSKEKKGPQVSFRVQIDKELYSCPLEEYVKYEDQIKALQTSLEIQPAMRFDHHFNSPTCGRYYISSEENFKVLGIRDLFKYSSDRSYSLPKGRFNEAMNSVLTDEEKAIFAAEEKKMKDIESNYALFLENRKRQEKILKTLSEAKDISKKDLLEHMPAFVEHLMHIEYPRSIKIDIPNKLATYIRGYSDYNGSGGSEYGLYITAWYNGELKAEKVVYRDRYNQSKDDRSLNFDTLTLTSATKSEDGKKIEIKLLAKSKEREKKYGFTFDVNEEIKKSLLSSDEQQEFKKKFTEGKQAVLQLKGEDFQSRGIRKMPVYCLPAEMCFNNMPQDDVPYSAPTISSEYIDPSKGKGAVIIKTQIDHCAGHKRQFEREGYIINQDGSYTYAFRDCAWDSENKQIRTTAEDLLKQ